MNDRLLPCPSCTRHVRASEEACPFCAAVLPQALPASALPRSPGARLSRAALYALGAAAAAVAACGGQSDTGVVPAYGAPAVDSGQDDSSAVPLYGAPAVDAGEDAPVLLDAAYGGPPQDAAADAADADASREGGITPAYGGPPQAR